MRVRHLITAGCLVAAIACYAAGARNLAALMLLGLAFEVAFWIRLTRSKKHP
ncbi:hypothetical protein [Massilia eurypsychrophila]|jgi:hypothetical protein|uniref:hypothetical protein n=1 Tax=Massilia eurypsychrophila TaxID=1485217 RepID=UPI0015D4ED27|nr:hypothetical protein [Massilia eurypsychrophila]